MKIGIIPNLSKDTDLKITGYLYNWLKEKEDIEVILNENIASIISESYEGCTQEFMFSTCDVIIILGGDGTLLSVARLATIYNVPLFGINLGHLGFLTQAEVGTMFEKLDKFLAGQYTIEKRMMLEAKIEKDNIESENFIALNDIGIARGPCSRILRYKIFVNNNFVDLYSADGLVIASPTGSTAYSLSAGGPIVSPDVEALIITPICSHTLHSRSIVISSNDVVRIEISTNNIEVMLSVDGQHGYKLKSGDVVTIKKSSHYTSLIKLEQRNFFEVLREKISEKWN